MFQTPCNPISSLVPPHGGCCVDRPNCQDMSTWPQVNTAILEKQGLHSSGMAPACPQITSQVGGQDLLSNVAEAREFVLQYQHGFRLWGPLLGCARSVFKAAGPTVLQVASVPLRQSADWLRAATTRPSFIQCTVSTPPVWAPNSESL